MEHNKNEFEFVKLDIDKFACEQKKNKQGV